MDGGGFDGGVAGDGVRILDGIAVLVAGVRGPDDGELGLAGLGGAVGLLPLAALGLGLADGDAGAVEAEVEGVGLRGFGFDDAALILGDGFPEGFGLSFHQLGLDVETGQRGQQFAALGEADSRRDEAGHAERGGRQGGGVEPESAVAGSEALGAVFAVIPGAGESQGAEGGGEGLGPAAGVAGLGPTTTDNTPRLVRVIGVEALGNGVPHDPERHLAGGGLDRLEVEAVQRARADQALGFGGALRRDLDLEPLFWAVGADVSDRSRN